MSKQLGKRQRNLLICALIVVTVVAASVSIVNASQQTQQTPALAPKPDAPLVVPLNPNASIQLPPTQSGP